MNFNDIVRNPIIFAGIVQIIGLIVAWYFDSLGEAIIVSIFFWVLVKKVAKRKRYTIGDQLFIRFGLVVFISIIVTLWGHWGVRPY